MYPRQHGGTYEWALHGDAHLTELSDEASDYHRAVLVSHWRRHWDESKHMLVESSPRHAMMTRLLQHWFEPAPTHFIVVLRHPLATLRDLWEKGSKMLAFRDCGASGLPSL